MTNSFPITYVSLLFLIGKSFSFAVYTYMQCTKENFIALTSLEQSQNNNETEDKKKTIAITISHVHIYIRVCNFPEK